MALITRKITVEIHTAAFALRPQIVAEISALIDGYLNDKKLNLRHSQVNPGEFLIHPDQPELHKRIKELRDEILRLEAHDRVFDVEGASEKKPEPKKEPVPIPVPEEDAGIDKPLPENNLPKRKKK